MTNSYQSYLITSATVGTSNLSLTLNGTPTFIDEGRIVLRFAPNIAIPASSASLPVVITVGSNTYPLWDRFGNPMVGADLKANSLGTSYCARLNYLTYYGATSTHLIAHNYPKVTCSYYAS